MISASVLADELRSQEVMTALTCP